MLYYVPPQVASCACSICAIDTRNDCQHNLWRVTTTSASRSVCTIGWKEYYYQCKLLTFMGARHKHQLAQVRVGCSNNTVYTRAQLFKMCLYKFAHHCCILLQSMLMSSPRELRQLLLLLLFHQLAQQSTCTCLPAMVNM